MSCPRSSHHGQKLTATQLAFKNSILLEEFDIGLYNSGAVISARPLSLSNPHSVTCSGFRKCRQATSELCWGQPERRPKTV